MILVGLTGGVATGKSTIAEMFERCGAYTIDADLLARKVVEPGTPAWRAIVREFGRTILNPDHTLDRRAISAIVFANPTKLRRLERIVHPRVAREQAKLTREATRKDPRAVVIYDVPLLFEAGIDTRVGKIIVVTADRHTQIVRLKRRNGLTRAEALRRIRSQMPLKSKAAAADYLLDGTTARSRLLVQVRRLYRTLRRLA